VDGRTARRRRNRLAINLAILAIIALGFMIFGGRPIRAAGLTVNLDQWASTELAWQNGNLNGNNSRYPEGGIVPFRLAMENLAPGNHTIHINYDFTAGGHKAYDFLATWNRTNTPGICSAGGGAVSSMCPGLPESSSFAFPSDGFTANGLSVSGAQVYSGASRRLTIWGGTITDIAGPTHAGSVNGNSTADFLVSFTSTGSSVLLAWGGHLAQSTYWDLAAGGPPDGAGEVSGAPWHMRTLQLDGSGNKNQDRSIQPSAIVGVLPPFALAPTPPPPPATPAPAALPTPTPAAGGTPSRPAPTPPASRPPSGAAAPPPAGTPTIPPTSTGDPAITAESAPGLAAGLVFLGLIVVTMLVEAFAGARRRRRPGG
jgi:hypothetical protein